MCQTANAIRILGAALFIVASMCGCAGDDNPCYPSSPDPIARMVFSYRNGWRTLPTSDCLWFRASYPLAEGMPSLGDVEIRDGDEGKVVPLDSDSSSSFDSFIALLVNGTEDFIRCKLFLETASGETCTINTLPESRALFDFAVYSEAPDLAGQEVTRVEAVIDRAIIKSPGRDPNGDGMWVDLDVTIEVLFFGPK